MAATTSNETDLTGNHRKDTGAGVMPDKAKGAEPRTQTQSEARSSASWWTKTIASQAG
jgi:hypothetical protein